MIETPTHLLRLWRDAVALKGDRQWALAAQLYERILAAQPDWEHGYGYFHLAQCYEEIGSFHDASSAYQRAVLSMPSDPILRGGFASFLYLHGDPNYAFEQYICLLGLDKKRGDNDGAAASITALISLGSRLGWSEEETKSQIEKAILESSS